MQSQGLSDEKQQKTGFLLFARDTGIGMETFINPRIFGLHSSYKNQLIVFLEQNLTLLKMKPENATSFWNKISGGRL